MADDIEMAPAEEQAHERMYVDFIGVLKGAVAFLALLLIAMAIFLA